MAESLISDGDVVIGANEPPRYGDGSGPSDSGGDVVLRTGGVVRGRVTSDGVGSGVLLGPSAPLSFAPAGSIVLGNGPYWLCSAGNVLYATVTNDNKLFALDISALDGIPTLLGSVTVGANSGWMEKKGKYLYLTDANTQSLRVIDVSNPAVMVVNNTLNYDASGGTGGGRFGLQVRGHLMLIGGPENGGNAGKVYLVNNAVPTAPTVVGSVASGGVTLRGCCSFGASYFAIASRDDAKVYIVDVSTGLPVVIATISTTQSNTTAAVQNQGTYLYVGNYGNGITGGLEVWDIAVPGAPVQAGVLSISGGCEQIVLRGANLYIGHRPTTAGNVFSVLDVRNPARPKLLGTYATGADQTPGIAVANGVVYRSSSEAPGSQFGRVYGVAMTDSLLRRISAIEDILQLRPPNIT